MKWIGSGFHLLKIAAFLIISCGYVVLPCLKCCQILVLINQLINLSSLMSLLLLIKNPKAPSREIYWILGVSFNAVRGFARDIWVHTYIQTDIHTYRHTGSFIYIIDADFLSYVAISYRIYWFYFQKKYFAWSDRLSLDLYSPKYLVMALFMVEFLPLTFNYYIWGLLRVCIRTKLFPFFFLFFFFYIFSLSSFFFPIFFRFSSHGPFFAPPPPSPMYYAIGRLYTVLSVAFSHKGMSYWPQKGQTRDFFSSYVITCTNVYILLPRWDIILKFDL